VRGLPSGIYLARVAGEAASFVVVREE
jgi:hypothetical protein